MKAKLTDISIRSRQPEAKQKAIGDSACPGLRIKITPKGVKSFEFVYRDKATGKVACLTIGRYPDVPLAKAREIANDARKAAALGETPPAAAQKNFLTAMPPWSHSTSTPS
jgi:hypothetical protein